MLIDPEYCTGVLEHSLLPSEYDSCLAHRTYRKVTFLLLFLDVGVALVVVGGINDRSKAFCNLTNGKAYYNHKEQSAVIYH